MTSNKEGLMLIRWDNMIGPFIETAYPEIKLSDNEILNMYIAHMSSQEHDNFLIKQNNTTFWISVFNESKNKVLVLILNSNKDISDAKEYLQSKMNEILEMDIITRDHLMKYFNEINNYICELNLKNNKYFKHVENLQNEINEIFSRIESLEDKYNALNENYLTILDYIKTIFNVMYELGLIPNSK